MTSCGIMELGQHWFRQRLVAYLALSHYLDRCQAITRTNANWRSCCSGLNVLNWWKWVFDMLLKMFTVRYISNRFCSTFILQGTIIFCMAGADADYNLANDTYWIGHTSHNTKLEQQPLDTSRPTGNITTAPDAAYQQQSHGIPKILPF